jgi:hypothetical protein
LQTGLNLGTAGQKGAKLSYKQKLFSSVPFNFTQRPTSFTIVKITRKCVDFNEFVGEQKGIVFSSKLELGKSLNLPNCVARFVHFLNQTYKEQGNKTEGCEEVVQQG